MVPVQQHVDVDEGHSDEEQGETSEKAQLIDVGQTESATLTSVHICLSSLTHLTDRPLTEGDVAVTQNRTSGARAKDWAMQFVKQASLV